MAKELVIGVDMDGVVADFILGFTTRAQTLFGETVPLVRTIEHLSWDVFPGLDKKQVNAVWDDLKKDPGFWYNLTPLLCPTEITRLKDLSLRHKLYFVTNRPGTRALTQSKEFLEDFLTMYCPNVVICGKKGSFCKAVDADFYIDDKPGNAVYTYYHCAPRTNVYIIDRPYNQFDQTVIGTKVKRIKQFSEFLTDIEGVLNGVQKG